MTTREQTAQRFDGRQRPARSVVQADDLEQSAAIVVAALTPLLEADWSQPAHAMTWSCRTTLDHMINTLFFYSGHVATLATQRLPAPRNGDTSLSLPDALQVVQVSAAILARLCGQMPPGTRAFHPSGMADAEGYLAMGCEEVLLHAWDITTGLGGELRPPDDLVRRITARIFPWAPQGSDVDAWDALRWAAGRVALPDRPQLGSDWWYWSAPLDEWHGERHARTNPPNWT